MLTKSQRQEILDDFLARHDGEFIPSLFVAECRAEGHPANGWFKWDDVEAGHEYRLWQARTFVRDLRIRRQIVFTHRGVAKAVVVDVPSVVSPIAARASGGGYISTGTRAGMVALREEAALALRHWLERYRAAVLHAGASPSVIERIAEYLEG